MGFGRVEPESHRDDAGMTATGLTPRLDPLGHIRRALAAQDRQFAAEIVRVPALLGDETTDPFPAVVYVGPSAGEDEPVATSGRTPQGRVSEAPQPDRHRAARSRQRTGPLDSIETP